MKTTKRGFVPLKAGFTPLRAGFTLIELLVVVVIIGVLFAVALPVFENAGRKDTNRAAQQVMNTLRLARQHAIAKRQWTFVVFPNRDGTYEAGTKGIRTVDKCLRSYAVIAVTNMDVMDAFKTYENDAEGPSVDDMDLEFVSDWKYLPEGIYFDDTPRSVNYVFGTGTAQSPYNPAKAAKFKFPLDPANPKTRDMIMSAVLLRPNGRLYTMYHGDGKRWGDTAGSQIRLTSAKYYEVTGGSLGDAKEISGTNTTIQLQGKTGMVKIYN